MWSSGCEEDFSQLVRDSTITLWQFNVAMENHHKRENQLLMAIFNSYVKLPEGNNGNSNGDSVDEPSTGGDSPIHPIFFLFVQELAI